MRRSRRHDEKPNKGCVLLIVGEVAVKDLPGVSDGVIGVEIDLLPFDRTPQTLDKDIIQRQAC
jgi:hypothetical protein